MEILYEQKIPFVSLTHRFGNEISVMTNDTGRQKFQLTGMVCILQGISRTCQLRSVRFSFNFFAFVFLH